MKHFTSNLPFFWLTDVERTKKINELKQIAKDREGVDPRLLDVLDPLPVFEIKNGT